MANRDTTSLWLHNKLGGTSNDSWISGSICSQLNKEVLRNIKDCFPDLQTQVKLKLLLSFFQIPRRLIEEWKIELDEILETAGIDSELWVSMLAETMKTLPASGSLNTEISDYEETRPIFADMVNDLKKLTNKHCDLGMLPLECQYLNKAALNSMVGQQSNPVKHFTLKRKPKSIALRAELLQKSSDAQSTLKKVSAPTIPLRSRGMPRKMTDTTPLKGIPSRVPTSGFRSPPTSQTQNRPNFSRIPAGRKDGGIKLLEITEQPLGYAAAKKRKRQQDLEEQQKKVVESQNNNVSATTPVSVSTTTPDYAVGLSATSVYTQPATPAPIPTPTPAPVPVATTKIIERPETPSPTITTIVTNPINNNIALTVPPTVVPNTTTIIRPVTVSSINSPSTVTPPVLSIATTATGETLTSLQSIVSTTITSTTITTTTTATTTTTTTTTIPTNVIMTQSSIIQLPKDIKIKNQSIITTPTKTTVASTTALTITKTTPSTVISTATITPTVTSVLKTQSQPVIVAKTVITSPTTNNIITLPPQTIIKKHIPQQPQEQKQQQIKQHVQIQSPKILQIKTTPTMPIIVTSATTTTSSSNIISQNIPPLIPTQIKNKVNIQSIQNVNLPLNRIQLENNTSTSNTSIVRMLSPQQTNIQIGTQHHQQQQQHTIVSSANAQTQKIAQVVMSSGMNVKGKTIVLANSNMLSQKGVILRSVGPSGNTIYQQIPLSSISGLTNLSGATIVTGPPSLIKSEQNQTKTIIQTHGNNNHQQLPALVPTSNYQNIPSLTPVMITSSNLQQQNIPALITNVSNTQPHQQIHQTSGGTIIRPVQMTTNVQGVNMLPQGLTLIQRPGGQPQLVQTIQSQPMQRTIITQQQPQQQQQVQQVRQQTVVHIPQQQLQQTQIQTIPAQQTNRKGLSLQPKYCIKAHEMFKNANIVTRLEKALILRFLAGFKDNPTPTPDNVLVIKLGNSKENIQQENGTYALKLVESFVRLDYNSMQWKTYNETTTLNQSIQIQGNRDDVNKMQNNTVIIN